jgi:hypothetical protein
MHKPQAMPSDLEAVTLGLLAYCRANDWAGYDPYDALNSRIFEALPFLNSRLPRLALTQLLKRSPVNIRPLLLIPKTQNPKALSLFLGGLLKLSRSGLLDDESPIEFMARKLVELRSPGIPYSSWGYSFPWQTRTIVVPRGSPNLVCTIFVTNALLDLYEAGRESRYLEMAVSAAEYISTLCWTEGDVASFAYPLATLRSRIHNANFLGAALLARVAKHSGEKKFLDPAMKAARWSASKQHADGSWPYGELPKQQWIDNFHTGYNLTGLRVLGECAGTSEFEPRVRRGFEFYRRHFFLADGTPRYFHDRTYPIDVHCVAQSIISLVEFKHLDAGNVPLARSVYDWAMKHMHDARGGFYYRVLPYCTIRTSYMRWSQAWMFLALSTLTEELAGSGHGKPELVTRAQVRA